MIETFDYKVKSSSRNNAPYLCIRNVVWEILLFYRHA